MPDKGKIMSQTYYERQGKLLNLYKELFARNEMSDNETVIALRMIGFSESIATNRVREWAVLINTIEPETERAKKQRAKQRASLESYVLQMMLGKKYYLRLKFMRKEFSREETVKKLIKSGCKIEVATGLVNEWEMEVR
jgi:hypothetical protein